MSARTVTSSNTCSRSPPNRFRSASPAARRCAGSSAAAPVIIFKGSGFYVTDSKNGKHAKQSAKKEEGSADTAAKDGSAKSGEKGGDKKPAESSKSSGDKAAKSASGT